MTAKQLNYINELLTVELLAIDTLKPHEEYCQKNFEALLQQINDAQFWSTPILVEKNHKIIMDGHHRYQIAQSLQLKIIPCILTSYNNPYLKVESYNKDTQINCEIIIEAGKCGALMKKKSTRHTLEFDLPKIKIPLSLLGTKL